MTDDEHIQKLIEERNRCLEAVYHWSNKAETKAVDENNTRNVAKEMNEYSGWLERAQKTQDMIDSMRKGKRAAKAPASPRRRHLNLA